VSVVYYQVEVSASGRSLVQRSPTDCSASLCVIVNFDNEEDLAHCAAVVVWGEKVLCLLLINLLKPTGHVMHHHFNIQHLYALPTLYLCVLYLSQNKQRLVPLTA
jgi:hypothetical protein